MTMSRTLTEAELARRDELAAGVETLIFEQMEVLAAFFRTIGAPEVGGLVHQPDRYLPLLDAWLREQDWQGLGDEDRLSLATNLQYYIAHVLMQRHHATWGLNDDPDSPHFLRYVVTNFAQPGDFVVNRNPANPAQATIGPLDAPHCRIPKHAQVDPLGAALELVRDPNGRSVAVLLAEIERGLVH
jgi:hypothetical protein